MGHRLLLLDSWCSSKGGDAPCTKNEAEHDLELPHPWDEDVSVVDGSIVNPVKGTKMEHERLLSERVGGNTELQVSECEGQEHEANNPCKEAGSWLSRVERHLKVREHHHRLWTPKKVGGSDHSATEVAKVEHHELDKCTTSDE